MQYNARLSEELKKCFLNDIATVCEDVNEANGIPLHSRWECKLIQPLWKTGDVQRSQMDANLRQSNSTPKYISAEMHTRGHQKTGKECANWNHRDALQQNKQVRVWYICMMKEYKAMKPRSYIYTQQNGEQNNGRNNRVPILLFHLYKFRNRQTCLQPQKPQYWSARRKLIVWESGGSGGRSSYFMIWVCVTQACSVHGNSLSH